MAAVVRRPDVGGAAQGSTEPIRFGAQGLDKARLRRGQQLREHIEVISAERAEPDLSLRSVGTFGLVGRARGSDFVAFFGAEGAL